MNVISVDAFVEKASERIKHGTYSSMQLTVIFILFPTADKGAVNFEAPPQIHCLLATVMTRFVSVFLYGPTTRNGLSTQQETPYQ